MTNFFLSNLKSTLDNCITKLDDIHSLFCRNPESDFTRNRKLSFLEYIQFMLQMQNKFYRMRWSEETRLRELKYTIGLINWHSSKYDGILQEIYARMILYNFCELVTVHAVVKTSEKNKHVYKINFVTIILCYGTDAQSVFLSYTKIILQVLKRRLLMKTPIC